MCCCIWTLIGEHFSGVSRWLDVSELYFLEQASCDLGCTCGIPE